VSCAGVTIGILYNFAYMGRVSAYQSGFVYRDADRAAKPGLTCHHAAINYALEKAMDIYDFLAGDDRYKRSLADRTQRLTWAEAGPFWSPRLLLRVATQGLRQPGK
jgi:CelD/BcsL family acetyltransferase involved in cellulose biosynthesis